MEKRTLNEIRAEKLAEFIHCGQKRDNGEDYIEHPRRIANAMKKMGYGEDVICTAWLHDTEDFKFPGYMLKIIDIIFGYKVYGMVLLLSHIPKSIPYNDYIYKIAETSQEAMIIKWEDMVDNSGKDCPDRQWKKYRNACLFLRSKGIEIPTLFIERLRLEEDFDS